CDQVLVGLGAVAPVLLGDLPPAQRVVLADLEPPELLLGTDVQPQLDDDDAFEGVGPLELDDLLVGPTPLLVGRESLDAFDEHAPVPTAIEHRHATEARHVRIEAPKERMDAPVPSR